ncbi:MG2 domain-containing protein [Trichonephila clavata]|uniref:MG2 domain-containing protein n=1 Tax=Trichonephila clavata TaxID=2740835 RepID=A0A8X6JBE8_TRICU|nr:MG2 domain-containing protein [Trichonephila clavata]
MKNFKALIAYLCIFCTVSLCSAKRGFILTAPKAIDAGSTEYLTFTAFDVPSGGQVTIKLLHWYSGDMLAESKVTVLNNINMWVE